MSDKSQHSGKSKRRLIEQNQNGSNRKDSSSVFLVLHNDDEHSFDYVINTLVEICKHEKVQAEQCAHIVHYKGQCEVKQGNEGELKNMQQQLLAKGLKVTLE